MNIHELAEYEAGIRPINAKSLNDKTERTLVYGYSLNREIVHVYLKDELIHLYVHFFDGDTVRYESAALWNDVRALSPSNKTYASKTDFEFANRMRAAGVPLDFIPILVEAADVPFHGKIYDAASGKGVDV